MTPQEILYQWSIDYDTSVPVFDGYTEPTRKYAGRCKFRIDSKGIRYGIILIRPELEGHPFLAKSVLWHEFCHHATWYYDSYTEHGSKWFKWLIKKPLMVIGEVFSAIKLIFYV